MTCGNGFKRLGWLVAAFVGGAALYNDYGQHLPAPSGTVIFLILVIAIVIWRYRDGSPIELSPKAILEAVEGETGLEEQERQRAFRGKLVECQGTVTNVSSFSFFLIPHYSLWLEDEDGTKICVGCIFIWGRELRGLKVGNRVKVRGRIGEFYLHDSLEIRAIRRPTMIAK